MADVKEVLFHMQKAFNITDDELTQVQDKKRATNGAFVKRLYTDFIEIEENNPEINRYAGRPEKYPEI
ncbi:MAG: hypothetical protein GY793_08655 [Proteobacteria bacterium]|nr:hypothetical protein [Pseudomonadota bacterium]